MNYISDILYWISTGLLVPVIVLLIILFVRSLLLIGSFFGQYLSIRKTDALLRKAIDELTPDCIQHLEKQFPDHPLHAPDAGNKKQSGTCTASAG